MVYFNIIIYNIILFIFTLISIKLAVRIKNTPIPQIKIGFTIFFIIIIYSYQNIFRKILNNTDIISSVRYKFLGINLAYIILFIVAKILLYKFVDKNKKFDETKNKKRWITRSKIHKIFNISYLLFFTIIFFIFLRVKELYIIFNNNSGNLYITLIFLFIYMNVYKIVNKIIKNNNIKTILTPVILNVILIIYLIIFTLRILTSKGIIKFDSHYSFLVVLYILFLLLIVFILYNFLSNMSVVIKNTNKPKNSKLLSTIFTFFMFISIFLMLWIKDSVVWNIYENLYVVILILFVIVYVMGKTYQNYFNGFMFIVFIIIFIKLIIGKWENIKNSIGYIFGDYNKEIKNIV